MTDKELLERAQHLQNEAVKIIDRLKIIPLLKKYSNPEIVGSVKNGLMVLPDIDIHCYAKEPNLKDVGNVMQELLFMPTIQMIHFNNYRELRRDYRKDRVNFPQGYYLGFRSIEHSGEWKIDMWFVEEGMGGDYDSSLLESLTDEQRAVILRLKEEYKYGKGYKDGAISTDFYRAVTEKGIKTIEEFRTYLLNK